MISEYSKDGRIFHVVNDPVPPGLEDAMRSAGKTFESFPPEPLPEEHERNPDTGEYRYDDEGNPVMNSPGMTFTDCDIQSDWFDGTAIARRPDCGCSVSIDGRTVTISALPEGSSVTVYLDDSDEGIEAPIENGSAVIELDEVGPLRIRITPPWPYLDETHALEIE